MAVTLKYTSIMKMRFCVWNFLMFIYVQKCMIQTGILVSAEIISETFDVTKINGISYGKVLITFTVRSKLECFKDCSQWDKCVSLVYNPVTRVCEANEVTAGAASTTCVGSTCYFYASKVLSYMLEHNSNWLSQVLTRLFTIPSKCYYFLKLIL